MAISLLLTRFCSKGYLFEKLMCHNSFFMYKIYGLCIFYDNLIECLTIVDHMAENIEKGKPSGGLLLQLPQIHRPEKSETFG